MKTRTVYVNHVRTIADLLTPVGVYTRLRDHYPNALLLESADYHDRSDSKSFICIEPIAGFEAKGNSYSIDIEGEEALSVDITNPKAVFGAFKQFVRQFRTEENNLPFNGSGLFGYTSYEAVQYMEDIVFSSSVSPEKDNPFLKYQLFKHVLIFDHFKSELYLTTNSLDQPTTNTKDLDYILQLLQKQSLSGFKFHALGEEESNIRPEQFKQNVEKGIAHCKRGDVFQLVLSREFRQRFSGDELNVYRSLRSINPSPYLFYFDYGDFKIFGSSPEAQLEVKNGVAFINPIAGTILRGADAKEDERQAERLKQDPKEISEHVMLVDLARNDLSKSSDEVQVETYAEIQRFSHVLHLVSKVGGKIRDGLDGLDVFSDTFPAGTLSGAPKYRAMQIIDENEKTSRNFYGGAIGFVGFDGTINQAIIIRSALSKNNTLLYQAGAGIVAGSTPEGELDEVDNKVAALRKAIKKAQEL